MATARAARRSLQTEAFALGELATLMADPVNYGLGVPPGDGRYVLVLPGMFASDTYLYPMRSWLDRIGYRAVRSTLRSNVGCPERLTRQIESELTSKLARSDRPVALIGHSRGGLLARAIAVRLGERASHLVLLGSPVSALSRLRVGISDASIGVPPAGELVIEAGTRARARLDPQCAFPACGCPFPADARAALHASTRVVSIFSRSDPIVPAAWARLEGARNVEVDGTHSGLVYNGAVYREIARTLASD
jgi:pimeloyl-ACP methyl ester carboxylesterase